MSAGKFENFPQGIRLV